MKKTIIVTLLLISTMFEGKSQDIQNSSGNLIGSIEYVDSTAIIKDADDNVQLRFYPGLILDGSHNIKGYVSDYTLSDANGNLLGKIDSETWIIYNASNQEIGKVEDYKSVYNQSGELIGKSTEATHPIWLVGYLIFYTP